MIDSIIFDFGDVFINLDKQATFRELQKLGVQEIPPALFDRLDRYEKGLIATSDFVSYAMAILPGLEEKALIQAWNAILLDLPQARIDFLKALKQNENYRCYLLSNTNELHIQSCFQELGSELMEDFFKTFDKVYLSHEINMSKPDPNIFRKVIMENALVPERTLFVDDTFEHIESAKSVGLKTWHLEVGTEDITQLKSKL
ncbi:MAG: HAD-IA family hydrolase [Flavobacteriaceae bacterium]|nr:HAD-IA family hydrolase [Flavobacteriaceae bacterium]MDH3795618.1 HAD-IA family hydrolase [Flavobacteriaceae bacterium]